MEEDPHALAIRGTDIKGLSIRKAAIRHGTSRENLRRRILSIPIKSEAQKHRQRLSQTLKVALAAWVLTQARLGWAPPHSRFRIFARTLIKALTGHENPLGKRW